MDKRFFNSLIDLCSFYCMFLMRTVSSPAYSAGGNEFEKGSVLCLTVASDSYYLKLYEVFSKALSLCSKDEIKLSFIDVTGEFESWLNSKTRKILPKKKIVQSWWGNYSRVGKFSGSNLLQDYEINNPALISQYSDFLSTVKSKNDFLELHIHGVKVGDLINDTYLRYQEMLTLDLSDPYLLRLILNVHILLDKIQKAFDHSKPRCLVTPYCTYLHWGVWSRLAIKNKIPLYAIGNVNQFIRRVDKSFISHVKDHTKYPDVITKLPPGSDERDRIRQLLNDRLSGGKLDDALFYLKNNPFKMSIVDTETSSNLDDRIVFMLHSFTDCPHVYRWMLFSDFYEWICRSIEYCRGSGITCAVKIHPAEPLYDQVEITLKALYPDLMIIPQGYGNREIAESKVKGIVTIHGTACYEFGFLNIPVLCAGDNPHSEFSFCHLPKTKEEYFKALSFIDKSPIPDKGEIINFYFAHNHAVFDGRISSEAGQLLMQHMVKGNGKAPESLILECVAAITSSGILE